MVSLSIYAAAGAKEKTFAVPADVLYEAAVHTAAHEHKLTDSDASRFRFSFHARASAASWGLVVKAHVEPLSETTSRLILVIENANSNQIFSWGAGGRMADDLFKSVDAELLTRQPGQYSFIMLKPTESESLVYEDESLNVAFQMARKSVNFRLRNKTDNPLKIDWNQLAYVDVDGKSHRVLHKGIAYKDKEASMPPSSVPPTAVLEDLVEPTDYVKWSDLEGGFRNLELLPNSSSAGAVIGKTVSVFMPIEVNGVVKNYLFSFKVSAAQTASKAAN